MEKILELNRDAIIDFIIKYFHINLENIKVNKIDNWINLKINIDLNMDNGVGDIILSYNISDYAFRITAFNISSILTIQEDPDGTIWNNIAIACNMINSEMIGNAALIAIDNDYTLYSLIYHNIFNKVLTYDEIHTLNTYVIAVFLANGEFLRRVCLGANPTYELMRELFDTEGEDTLKFII